MRFNHYLHMQVAMILAGACVVSGWCAPASPATSESPTFDYNPETYAELTNSLQQARQQLTVAEKTFGNTHTNVADLLSKLAGFYDDSGDYAQAATLYDRCLVIRESVLGSENKGVADALNDLAWEYKEMGDYENALPLFQRSLKVTEDLLGPENCEVATTMNNLANVYGLMGDNARALLLCQRALEIRRKVLGRDHLDVTDGLISLAEIYRSLGNDREALALCRQSVAICEKHLGADQPLEKESLFLLGQVQLDLGNYPEASTALLRALAINEKYSSPDDPYLLQVFDALALLYAKQHDSARSLSAYDDLFQRQRHYFVGQILALADPDVLRSIQRSFQSVEIFHSLCGATTGKYMGRARLAGATELILNKALLEEVRAAQAAFESDPQTATKELREQYRAAQFQLAHLGKGVHKQMETRRGELQDELSRIEAKLAERVGLVAQAIRERNLTLKDIARNLPPQSALVDFIQYRRYDFAARTNQWQEQRYAVYLTFPLAKDSTNVAVERVDLGEAAPINEAVELVCKRMSAGQFAAKDLPATLQKLSQLIYAPLAPHLTNVSHLIVCPDGQLSRLPFEMLPIGNKFLVEEKTISYVTSGREIVRIASPKSSVHSSKSLVMGNPDFNLDLNVAQASQPAGSAGILARSYGDAKQDASRLAGKMPALLSSAATRSLSRSYRGMTFTPLPGSGVEATNVAKLLGNDAVLRLGPEAREAELKAVASPRVLHLATHGFFLSDQEFKHTNSLAWSSAFTRLGPSRNGGTETPNDWENPLVRCGIALAGANHAMQITNAIAEDGLLTGLEASLLNLQGTELVILSACDSGAGEVKIGEGVMSLRRAFRIAGAESVLASHWPVNDKATSRLMTEFMRRWRAGEPRAQAWREAQLGLLRSKDFSNPYFWSAFTLTGQWN